MPDDNDRQLALTHGRTLHIERAQPDGDRIQIRSGSGEIELDVVLTAEGVKVRLRALDLELEAARAIRMRCETFELDAERDARILASRGGIALHANDDVDVRGERVLLNADAQPIPATWDELEKRVSEKKHP